MRCGGWAVLLAAACVAIGGAQAAPETALASVERGIAAMGGARLAHLRAVTVRGSSLHFEPQQSWRPDGEAVPSGRSSFVLTHDLVNGAARTEWRRELTTPVARTYAYTEVVTPAGGWVTGVDSSGRTRQSRESTPPQHAMAGQRVAVMLRELQRASPQLLIAMRAEPRALRALPPVFAGGRRLDAVRYEGERARFDVLFDPQSGLPARVRSLDTDQAWGDIDFDLVLADWREVGGLRFPFQQTYLSNGRVIALQAVDEIVLDPPLAPAAFAPPAALRAALQPPARRDVEYQWVFRRMLAGGLLDTESLAYDPRDGGLRLVEIGPGVHHLVGGNPNNLVVEMSDHLVVFDAPNGEAHTAASLAAIAARYPRKPVKVLVLTHHHMDHASGARGYGAAGAKIVVGKGVGAYIRHMMAAPHRVRPDALTDKPRTVEVVEVADRLVLADATRSIELYRIDNSHAEGMLIGYLPELKLGYVTDLWAPGRDAVFGTERQRALVDAVDKAGIAPERFAGGHGGVAAYREFAAKVRGAQ